MPRWFEHFVEWTGRLDRSRREFFQAGVAILVLFVVGTSGYVYLEEWAWMDGVYMTFITLTTIGFGEVRPLSDAGKLFTILISVFGIGLFAFIATRGVQLLVANHQRLRQRIMERRIERLKGHYIVCGAGRLGRRIATDLANSGTEFVVIERAEDRAAWLEERGYPFIFGDAEQEETLHTAGIGRAQGLILTLPEDSGNVFVALSAREVRGAGGPRPDRLLIIARTNQERNTPKLLRAGVDKVVSPYEIGADRMVRAILRPHVDEFMEQVMHVGALDLEMQEAAVSDGSDLAGRTLAESAFRQRFNAIVVAVRKGVHAGDAPEAPEWMFNPGATTTLDAGDMLLVLGTPDEIKRVRQDGCMAGTG